MIVRVAVTCVAAAALLLGAAACGSSGGEDPPACEVSTPSQPRQIEACFSGALTGEVRTVAEPPDCPDEPWVPGESWTATFVTMLGPDITRVEIGYRDKMVPGRAEPLSSTGSALVNVSQRERKLNWSNVIGGAVGEVTAAPDGSGTLRVSLPQRDYSSGAPVPNAPKLELSAAWRC